MNKTVSSRVTLILFSLVLALSIGALGMLGNRGLGWFADNDKVTADGMSITVNGDHGVVDNVQYYEISSIALEGGNNVYTFTKEINGNPSLGEFSTLVANRQILIKITLDPSIGAVTVSADSSAPGFISSVKENGNSLSSAVAFYAVSGEDVEAGSDGPPYVISSGDFYGDGAYTFSDITVSGSTVTATFDPEITDLFTTEDGAHESAVFIIVDYYEDAAEHIVDLANQSGLGGKTITFIPDFEITVSKKV